MAMSAVTIYYGPSESFNTYDHKPLKLRGLIGKETPLTNALAKNSAHIDRLRKLGYRLDLIPVDFLNYCKLEMCGHEVFRCNLQNLKYNTSYVLDPVCQRAIEAVLESTVKFRRARTYLYFWTFIERQLLTRSKYGPQDAWPTQLKLDPFPESDECAKCCIDRNS